MQSTPVAIGTSMRPDVVPENNQVPNLVVMCGAEDEKI